MFSDPTKIIQSLERFQIVTYLHLSCNGLLVYDYLLTFADEVRYVYGAPWTLGRILFYLTRYPVFVDTALTLHHQVGYSLSVQECITLFKITGWMIIIGIVIAEVIMTLRVWALWGRTRNFGIFLSILSVATIAGGGVAFFMFHSSQAFIAMDDINPVIPGCFPDDGNNVVFVSFTVLMGYESVIFILTLIKAIQHCELQFSLGSHHTLYLPPFSTETNHFHNMTTVRHGSNSFITAFFQDGIVYFAALLVVSFANVIILLTEPNEYANLLTSIQRALHSILSARILLRLRQESERTRNVPDAPTEIGPVGQLVFARSQASHAEESTGISTESQASHPRGRPWDLDDGSWFGNGTVSKAGGETDYA
ncbi:hypothetical protein BDN71DRAFT_1478357 [Pleurotus eryngii]|uniref:DUF6533 domain-containing protein n=1 Tax=Pleurotus eryngii TaxID=5323 RepID=A0A9P5ZJL6_PLEER|nr:hypothetical protein BDN71DRAFT_1478357 [Pleurotus eryngii]